MKLSDMRAALDREGIRLTKSLGQNFLHDANQLRRIVQAAALSPADKVLESGPASGRSPSSWFVRPVKCSRSRWMNASWNSSSAASP